MTIFGVEFRTSKYKKARSSSSFEIFYLAKLEFGFVSTRLNSIIPLIYPSIIFFLVYS